MKFRVMNANTAENYKEDFKHVLIGVRTEENPPEMVLYQPNPTRLESLLLAFADLDVDRSPKAKDYKYHLISSGEEFSYIIFDEGHADKILDFYLEWKDKVELFVIHCEAGLSRSPAIAAALSIINGQSDEFFFRHYHPNRYIYRTIIKRAVERGIRYG